METSCVSQSGESDRESMDKTKPVELAVLQDFEIEDQIWSKYIKYSWR